MAALPPYLPICSIYSSGARQGKGALLEWYLWDMPSELLGLISPSSSLWTGPTRISLWFRVNPFPEQCLKPAPKVDTELRSLSLTYNAHSAETPSQHPFPKPVSHIHLFRSPVWLGIVALARENKGKARAVSFRAQNSLVGGEGGEVQAASC
jgi:hypothetical protein